MQQRLNTERFEWEADYAPGGGIATPTPVPAPTGSSIDDPIESDGLLPAPDGIVTGIAFTVPNAWRYVHTSNQFNDSPSAGNRFYMLGVVVSNYGKSSASLSENDFKLVGDRHVLYEQNCSILYDELDVELFPDGQATLFQGNGLICFEMPEDEEGLILIYEPWLSWNTPRRFIKVPAGCPNQETLDNGVVVCQNTANHDFTFTPQLKALGAG